MSNEQAIIVLSRLTVLDVTSSEYSPFIIGEAIQMAIEALMKEVKINE